MFKRSSWPKDQRIMLCLLMYAIHLRVSVKVLGQPGWSSNVQLCQCCMHLTCFRGNNNIIGQSWYSLRSLTFIINISNHPSFEFSSGHWATWNQDRACYYPARSACPPSSSCARNRYRTANAWSDSRFSCAISCKRAWHYKKCTSFSTHLPLLGAAVATIKCSRVSLPFVCATQQHRHWALCKSYGDLL